MDKPTILLVDDTPANLMVLSGVLKKEYRTLEAANGRECLALAASERPDLILLDIMMPGIDGYEVCTQLKADPATRDIPVIFATALQQEQDEIRGFQAGAVDYVTKPFRLAVVKARVKTHLTIRQQQAELRRKQQNIEDDLKAAGVIQQSLLPKRPPDLSQASFAWKFQPCDAVGGDILNVVRLDQNHVGIYMLDVAGHGPPAAMLSVMVYQLMSPLTGILLDESTPPRIREPEDVLNILDREFPQTRFERHFTIIYMVLNLATGRLLYSNAAHCAPLVLRADGRLERLEISGTIIGLNIIPFGQGSVDLTPGDKVLLYSDGVIEMENSSREYFDDEGLAAAITELRTATPAALVAGIHAAATRFAGQTPPNDDLSILAFELH